MATAKRTVDLDTAEFEVFQLDLDEAERSAFLGDPTGSIRELLGEEHVVNRVLIDTAIMNGVCAGGTWELRHVLSGPGKSTHMLFCINPV